MDVHAIKAVWDHYLLIGSEVAFVFVAICAAAYMLVCACRHMCVMAKRIGWASVAGLFSFCVWATITGTPTQEEKEDALEQGQGEAQTNAMYGAMLLGFGSQFNGGSGADEDGVTDTHDQGSTQDPEQSPGPMTAAAPPPAFPDPVVENEIVPGIRPLTIFDHAAGFALSRIGTGEVFDFSAPEGATVCEDWLAFGASRDWFRTGIRDQGAGSSCGGFAFPFGTNRVDALTVFSNGSLRPRMKRRDTFVSPFETELCVVPSANWPLLDEDARPSRFWHYLTSSNTLVMTWQNVLLDQLVEKPVSFQAEFSENGNIVFRYDLSRLADTTVSNLVVGIRNAGYGRVFTQLGRDVTSLHWTRLDPLWANDSDPDGDGVSTDDEVLVYHTDPYSSDTDMDMLSDYDEINLHHTDPNDPNSVSDILCDGMAKVIGDLDPFSCPEGSTNTVLEHVFYTGTTNTPFAYPVASESTAVLYVTVSGSGSGRLVIGDRIVPLLPRPRLLMGANGLSDPTATTLRVAVQKGVRYVIWGSVPETLEVVIDSGAFTIGRLPRWYTLNRGWIAFPNTTASAPCIHDLGSRRVAVSLDPGSDISDLTCTWNDSASIEVEHRPPLAAELTGHFPRSSTTPVTYTLSHPDYLFGATTYTQTARFCPRLSEDDDHERCDKPVDSEYGDEPEGGCTCWDGVPCGNRWCDCGCPCCRGDVDYDEETPLWVCKEHNCHYSLCAQLHRASYTNALALVEAENVLKLDRDPVCADAIDLLVPDDVVRCCDCPDHRTNYVALASKTYNLAVRTEGGERFRRTVEDCTVFVSGLAPSLDFDDSSVSFCKTGVVYEAHRYTVLGLKVDCPYFDITRLNRSNPDFGLPIVVGTNRSYGTVLRLRTDVDLPDGNIHIGFSDPTPGLRLYLGLPDDGYGTVPAGFDDGALLVDSSSGGSLDISLAQWKRIVRERASERDMFVTLVAEREGSSDLEFGYMTEHEGRRIGDVVRQRLTAISSPLMADYNHNGMIDDTDREWFRIGRPFRFWTNEDKIKTDVIPVPLPVVGGVAEWLSPEPYNIDDHVVNGTYDLLNLFPVAIDLGVLTNRWRNADVTFVIGSGGGSLRVTFADIAWDSLRSAQTNDILTVGGTHLREAPLHSLGLRDVTLDDSILGCFGESSGVMLAESSRQDFGAIALKAYMDGVEVFRAFLPIRTSPVRDMYRWINARHLSGEDESRATDVLLPDNAPYGVDGMKKLIFLHGANVAEPDAEFWGEQLFKRLWHTGCDVDFYNVDWRSDIGPDANYHQNVSNAFEVASRLWPELAAIPGEKVIMAHSLGNMVVSSMMQDYGLTNSIREYIVCNSAVPSEAYAEPDDISMRVPQLVHPDWEDYPTNSWASNWHKLFKNDVGDDRKFLGWPGRFIGVKPYISAVFYSTGDEVLEMYKTNSVSVLSGVSYSLGRYSWHKQELFKGRGMINGLGGTTWAGWNIEENIFGVNKISATEAIAMDRRDPSEFKTNTVFYLNPPSMNQSAIPLLVRGAHLAMGIPALAPSTGWTGLQTMFQEGRIFDENVDNARIGVQRPNDWPLRSNYGDRWLHSDMKDVSYFYNYKFYEKLKEKGCFQ